MSDDLPFEGPLIQGSYFLEPEELFGVQFKAIPEGWPIPLQFDSRLPNPVHPLLGKKYEIIYTGYRPYDTYSMHKYFSSMGDYPFHVPHSLQPVITAISQKNLNRVQERRPFIGMKPYLPPDYLHFDSKFENGNLDRVVAISEREYDLYIRSDTNSRKHYTWFYFSVYNIKNKGRVKFNVVNITGSPVLYSKGMTPVHSSNQIDWERCSLHVECGPSKISTVFHKSKKAEFSMLSFEFEFSEKDIKIFFARSVPYTFTQLLKCISNPSPYVKVRKLCTSVSGISVPKLTITDSSIEKQFKKYILIVGRMDPGETVSSYVIEGLINFLLSDHQEARRSREKFIYKIIPMVNIEGVIIGNSCCNIAGVPIHKNHSSLLDIFCTDIRVIQKLAYKIQSRNRIFLFMEICGSFKNLGSFTYPPECSKDSHKYLLSKVFVELMHRYSLLARVLPKNGEIKAKRLSLKCRLERELRIDTYVNTTSIFGYIDEKTGLAYPHDLKLLNFHGFFIGEFIYRCFEYSTRDLASLQRSHHISIPPMDLRETHPHRSESKIDDLEDKDQEIEEIIGEINRPKTPYSTDFAMSSSSDDESIDTKKYLIESLQDYSSVISKIIKKRNTAKLTSKFTIAASREINDHNQVIRVSTTVLRSKRNECPNRDVREGLSLSNINMSRFCMEKNNERIALKGRLSCMKPVKIYRAKIKEKKDNTPKYVIPMLKYEISILKSQSTTNLKGKPKSQSKYHRFGPFPNLRAVNSLILSIPLA